MRIGTDRQHERSATTKSPLTADRGRCGGLAVAWQAGKASFGARTDGDDSLVVGHEGLHEGGRAHGIFPGDEDHETHHRRSEVPGKHAGKKGHRLDVHM